MWNHSQSPGPSSHRQSYQPDVNAQTRVAITTIAKRMLEEEKRRREEDEESQVFLQHGYGESDSDEDTGGVRVPLPKNQQKSHDEVFIPPAVRQQDLERAARSAQNQQTNSYQTFPTQIVASAGHNPYAKDDDVVSIVSSTWSSSARRRSRSRKRSRSRSRSPKRRRRDDSRDSRRSRHKKSKKKRRRRRSSSSSSSSSSGDSRDSRSSRRRRNYSKDSRESRRRRNYSKDSRESRRRRENSPPTSSIGTRGVITIKESNEKYGFLEDKLNVWSLSSRFIVTDKKFDPENFHMGCPRREISQMHLGVKYILGMEHRQDFFNRVYSQELRQEDRKLLKRSFAKELEDVAKHRPKETFFRKREPKDGYWKLIQHSDILNEVRESGDITDPIHQTDGVHSEIENLRKAIKDNDHDIESLLKYIDLEEKNCKLNQGSFATKNPRDLAEEILSRLEKAIKKNPRETVLLVLQCEQMIKAEFPKETILEQYKRSTHLHPYDPMLWLSYLDYIQYDANVFTTESMKSAFSKCLKKVDDLLSGTLASHAHMIRDRPAFREFHLAVYMRYLKWCFSNGNAPQAIANIQASMELNLGMSKDIPDRKRLDVLKNTFWYNELPRIGDPGGLGIEEMSKKTGRKESALDLEREELQDFFRQAIDAQELLREQSQQMEKNWVDFERRMQEVDARPKRIDYQEIKEFEGAREELDALDVFLPVFHDDLVVYQAYSSVDVMDWTQPMLELLGVKFFHSPGCFTSTEQVISEYRRKDIFHESLPNFPETPSYTEKTCKTMGLRIMKFLIEQRHQEHKNEKYRLDDQMMKYLLAGIETQAQSMETDGKFCYYKLKVKSMKTLLASCNKDTQAYKTTYALLSYTLAIFSALKLTVWLERGVAEQKELKTLYANRDRIDDERNQVLLTHALLRKDEEGLENYRAELWKLINSVTKALESPQRRELNDPAIPYSTLQLLLYSKILLARQYVASDGVARSIRKLLAKDIMQEDDDVIEGLDINGALYRQFIGTVWEWVEMISKRDKTEENEAIPEFPRVGPLCTALLWAVEFVFLDQNRSPRQTIKNVANSLLAAFNEYDRNRNDHTRTETQKYRDRVDIQFLFDTLIALFSHNNFRVSHYEDYQNLIIRASETFTCETKYMLKLAELFSTNRFQWMKIRGRIEEKNRQLTQKMRHQFDVQNERRLLMNTLTGMFATMRISGKNRRFVYDSWRREAMTLRDPAVWRMVMKAAAVVDKKSVEETFIRGNAQCPMSHNLHIDYVEHAPHKLAAIMEMRQREEESQDLHHFFLDNIDSLSTFYEIGAANARNRMVQLQDDHEAEDPEPENRRIHNLNPSQEEEDVKPSGEELETSRRRQEVQNQEIQNPQNPPEEDVKPTQEQLVEIRRETPRQQDQNELREPKEEPR